jgi:MFS transporter, DHA2 family, multidrug resistance protein
MAAAQDIANRVPITAALMVSALMTTLDTTIANVALPHMQGALSASQDQIIWVLTSYIIASAIMLPLSGWLSMKIGRKWMFLLSISGFTGASMLCGMAANLPEMVVFRLIQGVAGASLMPLSQAVMLDVFPSRLIPRVMSLWSAGMVLGPVLGPTLGGWLTETLSWRWVFFINLPLGVISFLGVYTFMAHDEGGRQRPFDFLGFGALAVGVGAFQLMLDRGPSQDWFDSREIWIEALLAVVGLYVFIVQTATAEHPFFHRDLAKDRNFVSTAFIGLFVFGLLMSTNSLLPSFMQTLMGYSALQSGLAAMPRGLASMLAFLFVPWLMGRFSGRGLILAGLLISVVATWQMSHFDLSMTAGPIMAALFVQGIGTGLLFTPLNVLGYATLDPHHRTEGAIVGAMTRNLGGSASISIMQSLLVRDGALAHVRLSERVTAGDPVVHAALPRMMDPSTGVGLQVLNGEVTRQASMISYDNVFSWMTLGIVLLTPLLLLVRQARARPALEIHVE